MIFEIKFTPEAEETYNAIISQLRERWGDKFVKTFEIKISKMFDIISTAPYSYPIDSNNVQLRKCVPHKIALYSIGLMKIISS